MEPVEVVIITGIMVALMVNKRIKMTGKPLIQTM